MPNHRDRWELNEKKHQMNHFLPITVIKITNKWQRDKVLITAHTCSQEGRNMAKTGAETGIPEINSPMRSSPVVVLR